MPYKIHLCGDTPCPYDERFEHRFYFGCVPKDFSDRTGRSKTHRQHKQSAPDLTEFLDPADRYRYRWNGGCDAHDDAAIAAGASGT